MSNIKDFNQEKIDQENPSLADMIMGFTAHNCDTNRPFLEQQPLRAAMEIKGLNRRDICDCMVLGILTCRPDHDYPQIYISEKGNLFKSWDDLISSDEGYKDSYIDAESVTYNDLYGWNLNEVDPVAAVQNMACFIERRMGVFPALIDGALEAD